MSTTLQHLSDLVGGQIARGEPSLVVTGLNSISEAQAGEITFLGNPRYLPALKTTQASAALVSTDFSALAEVPDTLALIRVENPTLAFSSVIRHFGPPPRESGNGVDATASVSPRAVFDPQKVSIGPCAVIEDDVRIGDGTIIHAGAFVGHGAQIGEDCVLHPNATIRERCVLGDRVILHSGCVIGADGFGYSCRLVRAAKFCRA